MSYKAARCKRARPRGGGTLQNGIRADSRGFTGTYGRKCGGMSTGAQMPPAWARARGGSVRGHLGCAVGTGRTDVAQGLLALDARTWHMGCWHWTYGTWPREDVPGLGLT